MRLDDGKMFSCLFIITAIALLVAIIAKGVIDGFK